MPQAYHFAAMHQGRIARPFFPSHLDLHDVYLAYQERLRRTAPFTAAKIQELELCDVPAKVLRFFLINLIEISCQHISAPCCFTE